MLQMIDLSYIKAYNYGEKYLFNMQPYCYIHRNRISERMATKNPKVNGFRMKKIVKHMEFYLDFLKNRATI